MRWAGTDIQYSYDCMLGVVGTTKLITKKLFITKIIVSGKSLVRNACDRKGLSPASLEDQKIYHCRLQGNGEQQNHKRCKVLIVRVVFYIIFSRREGQVQLQALYFSTTATTAKCFPLLLFLHQHRRECVHRHERSALLIGMTREYLTRASFITVCLALLWPAMCGTGLIL